MATNIHSSFVNQSEADALKNMIFSRVRERAEALNSTIEASYTADIKTDVMDAARKSFVSEKNPFSEVKNTVQTMIDPELKKTEDTDNTDTLTETPIKEASLLKTIDSDYTKTQIIENMNIAHNELSSKKGFIGALNFLNSQATSSLFRNKDNSFNTLA